jgi:hypothetical protein
MDQHPHLMKIAAWPYTSYGKRLIELYRMRPTEGSRRGTKFFEISRNAAQVFPRLRTPFVPKRRIVY